MATESSAAAPTAPTAPSLHWSFGFGSNMNVELVQTKKRVMVQRHCCAVLRGWRMAFGIHGMQKTTDKRYRSWCSGLCPSLGAAVRTRIGSNPAAADL